MTMLAPAETRLQAPLSAVMQKRLIFVGGKGGVGKTTLTAALGLALAALHPERRVRLLSTDPAHSLFKVLGRAEGLVLPPNVEVHELDAKAVFAEFEARHKEGSSKIAMRGTFLNKEDIQNFLDLGLPGVNELAALQVIARAVESRGTDHLLVDTAPTGHTLRLLALPDAVDGWRGALNAMLGKHRVMSLRYAGRYVADEADALIDDLERIATLARGVITDAAETAFLPVMNADPLCLWETARLLEALGRLGVAAPCVVINRVSPGPGNCDRCRERNRQEATYIRAASAKFQREIVEVPCLAVEPRGPKLLEAFGRLVLRMPPDATPEIPPALAAPRRTAEYRLPIPDVRRTFRSTRLLIVCGKGGVGKTTVAAALALRLAEQCAGRVLLYSIDPAHSLADALGQPVGSVPAAVTAHLDAVEINPEEQLRRLRDLYRQEITEFFQTLFSSEHIDATLDREAAERLIDLSPPGLDEVMALSELGRYLRDERYEHLVIDTAPAGHFLEFLELPKVIRSWIRAFFEVFLKYGKFLRAPKFQAFLINFSKALKEVQTSLHEALLIPVATPTELSLQQTQHLLTRVEQLGLSAEVAVLNRMVLSSGGCVECMRRAAASRRFLERYRGARPGLPFLCLEAQQQSPTGAAQLASIGRALFG